MSTTADAARLAKSKESPALYRDERAYLTAIMAGGFGLYSDRNPWFGRADRFLQGSPIAGRMPGTQPVWTEGFAEVGLGGATQLGNSPLYAFVALSGIVSWSLGQDVYRNDTRAHAAVEKAYAGLLYVDPKNGDSFNVSAGRQNVTLNDGFLIHFVRGSSNIGERGGTYLGPRNANQFSIVSDVEVRRWSFKGFYIDPDELPLVDTRSKFLVANVRNAITPDLSVDASVIAIPESRSTYAVPGGGSLPREGLRTFAGHLLWKRPFGADGVWLEGELAHATA